MYNPFSLEGKTILVTGASSGIGRATAIECSRMGAKVIITARNEERLKETLEQLEGDDHCMILCNLADTLAIDGLVSNLPEIHGLVNNAGFTKLSLLQFVKEEDLKSIFQVNTIAPVLLFPKTSKKEENKEGCIYCIY